MRMADRFSQEWSSLQRVEAAARRETATKRGTRSMKRMLAALEATAAAELAAAPARPGLSYASVDDDTTTGSLAPAHSGVRPARLASLSPAGPKAYAASPSPQPPAAPPHAHLPQLAAFLEQMHFSRDMESFASASGGKPAAKRCEVQLMTLHASKGLEFKAVFVIGWENGLMPNLVRAGTTEEQAAEEKRLAYVGCTRAKERLYLTTCKVRAVNVRRLVCSHIPIRSSDFVAEC
jgi:superfamily I DNA/RNA helicase